MSLNTILANKLGLLIDTTRNEPRDVFDIWFLLQRTSKFDFDFSRIRTIFQEKYGFLPSFDLLKQYLLKKDYKSKWEMRLKKQLPDLPNIDDITREILVKLEKLFSFKIY